MKRFINYFLTATLALGLFSFISCKTEPEEEINRDGIINIVNNTYDTIYVITAAVDFTFETVQECYDNRVETSSEISIESGKTKSINFNYSEYQDSIKSKPAIMLSYNKTDWNCYYYSSFSLYHLTTTIYVEPTAGSPSISEIKHSNFSFKTPNEIKKVPITNCTDYPLWVQFVAWEDDSWNYPIAMSERVLIKSGETVEISYPEGFENKIKSITAESFEYNIGAWKRTWTQGVPPSFNIYTKYNEDYQRNSYYFESGSY